MTSSAPVSRATRPAISPRAWTSLGLIAVLLWATWPALSLLTWQLPTFQCLVMVFLVASLTLGGLRTFTARAVHSGPSTGSIWVSATAFATGITGSAAFFLMATHYIPPAEANLIYCLWPAIVIGLGVLLGLFRLKARYVGGIALGFAGVAVMARSNALTPSYAGTGLALLAGLSWALYCVFRLKRPAVSAALLVPGFGLAALLCAVLHLALEPTVVPTITSAAATVAVGVVPAAFANWLWDCGFRQGNSQQLAVLSYTTPLFSALILVVLGFETLTSRLLMSAVLILLAGLLSHTNAARVPPEDRFVRTDTQGSR